MEIREYTNGEITVIWKPSLCTHAGECVRRLPEVFCPRQRPWVNMDNGTTDEIIEAVKLCPSGALTLASR